MKKLLLLTLLIVSPLMGQENTTSQSTNTSVLNNSLKLYLMAGLPAGIGLTYTGEFRNSANSSLINALNIDVQFKAIENTPTGVSLIGGNFGLQYSIGNLTKNGSRYYFDILGFGVNIFRAGSPYIFYSVKLLGFQHTLRNGFYWGLRSKLTFSTQFPVTVISIVNGVIVEEVFNVKRNDVGFGAYLAIGYDFGKKINPRDYESRMR